MPSFCQGLGYVFSFFGSRRSSNSRNYVINGNSQGYKHCSKSFLKRDDQLYIYAHNFDSITFKGGNGRHGKLLYFFWQQRPSLSLDRVQPDWVTTTLFLGLF